MSGPKNWQPEMRSQKHPYMWKPVHETSILSPGNPWSCAENSTKSSSLRLKKFSLQDCTFRLKFNDVTLNKIHKHLRQRETVLYSSVNCKNVLLTAKLTAQQQLTKNKTCNGEFEKFNLLTLNLRQNVEITGTE